MNRHPEKPKNGLPQIQLTEDGELYALPTGDDVRNEQAQYWEDTSRRREVIQDLKLTQEQIMTSVMERLKDLNVAAGGILFFAFTTGEPVMISRTMHVHELEEDIQEGVFLIISKKGFYAVRFPITTQNQGEGDIPRYDKYFHQLEKLLKPDAVITDQGLVLDEDEVRFHITGQEYLGKGGRIDYSSQLAGDSLLLSDEEGPLIQACLENSLLPYYQQQAELDKEAQQQEAALSQLYGQVSLADAIRSIVPEAIKPVDTREGGNWLRWFKKKKRD